MYDLKLNTATHDIELSDLNDLQIISDIERVKQQIKIRLLTFLGEWFLDTRVGIPWLENILAKNPNESYIKSLIYDQIIGVKGVKEIINIDISTNKIDRTMKINFKVSTIYGELESEVSRIV